MPLPLSSLYCDPVWLLMGNSKETTNSVIKVKCSLTLFLINLDKDQVISLLLNAINELKYSILSCYAK